MKLAKSKLKQIIREELDNVITEFSAVESPESVGGITASGLKGPPQLKLMSDEARKEYYNSPGRIRLGQQFCAKQNLCYDPEEFEKTEKCSPCS